MSYINIEKKVPKAYLIDSRDFQLLCRIFNVIENSSRADIESMISVLDTATCRDGVLSLWKTKLGIFESLEVTSDVLREILNAFPYIIKNKGSKTAIEKCIALFTRLNGIKTEVTVEIVNNQESDNGYLPYHILITIEAFDGSFIDTLDKVLAYVVPTGYEIYYKLITRNQYSNTVLSSDTNAVMINTYNTNTRTMADTGSYDSIPSITNRGKEVANRNMYTAGAAYVYGALNSEEDNLGDSILGASLYSSTESSVEELWKSEKEGN